ncbi:MAG: hypothetical protein WCA98_16495 [Candidatus Acidiferrales bacterium]
MDLFKEIDRNKRSMGPSEECVFPKELPHVERILKESFQIAFSQVYSELVSYRHSRSGKRILTGSVELEYSFRYRSLARIYFNRVLKFVVLVTQRRAAGIDPLFRLLPHSFFDLFPEVLDEISRDYDLDSVHKLGLRFRILAYYLAFFRQVNFHVQIFQRDAIPEITINTVCLFHDYNAATWILGEKLHHCPKLLSSRCFRGFDVYEFLCYMEFISQSVFAEEL